MTPISKKEAEERLLAIEKEVTVLRQIINTPEMSITAPITDTLQHAVVSGVVHEGITVQTYRNFWRGQGHLRVLSGARGVKP